MKAEMENWGSFAEINELKENFYLAQAKVGNLRKVVEDFAL